MRNPTPGSQSLQDKGSRGACCMNVAAGGPQGPGEPAWYRTRTVGRHSSTLARVHYLSGWAKRPRTMVFIRTHPSFA